MMVDQGLREVSGALHEGPGASADARGQVRFEYTIFAQVFESPRGATCPRPACNEAGYLKARLCQIAEFDNMMNEFKI
jgi:hypothetical protein